MFFPQCFFPSVFSPGVSQITGTIDGYRGFLLLELDVPTVKCNSDYLLVIVYNCTQYPQQKPDNPVRSSRSHMVVEAVIVGLNGELSEDPQTAST